MKKCTYCQDNAIASYNNDFLCENHYEVLCPKKLKVKQISLVKATELEKKLNKKYMKILEEFDFRNITAFDRLVIKFKKDLALLSLLLCTTISFSQTAPKYTFYVKFNKLLTTTKVDTALYKKINYYEFKVKGEFKNNSDALANGLKIGDLYSLPLNDGISLIAIVKPKQPETQGTITNTASYLSKEN